MYESQFPALLLIYPTTKSTKTTINQSISNKKSILQVTPHSQTRKGFQTRWRSMCGWDDLTPGGRSNVDGTSCWLDFFSNNMVFNKWFIKEIPTWISLKKGNKSLPKLTCLWWGPVMAKPIGVGATAESSPWKYIARSSHNRRFPWIHGLDKESVPPGVENVVCWPRLGRLCERLQVTDLHQENSITL